MTTIVVWVGVDTHGPASAYIASDSRISWSLKKTIDGKWDWGRKTFASTRFPDIAGYWGDVLFPAITLSQFFANLDLGVVAPFGGNSIGRFQSLEKMLRLSQSQMSRRYREPFSVIYVSRDGEGLSGSFRIRTISWSSTDGWSRKTLHLPSRSGVIQLSGSGLDVAQAYLAKWNKSAAGGTSRAVFSAFVDGLNSGADPHSGGPPQLVGLYRIGFGRTIGTVVGRMRYLNGMPVTARTPGETVEWRNELFERASGKTKRRLKGAQMHERPSDPSVDN